MSCWCVLGMVTALGAGVLCMLALALLPYVLAGLLVWVVVDFVRFHRRRMREAQAEAVYQAKYRSQWRR